MAGLLLAALLWGCAGASVSTPGDGGGSDSISGEQVPACGPGTCPGCCAAGLCVDGIYDDLCGMDGEPCHNCLDNGQTCFEGGCSGSCTPDCSGKCPGAQDGCGHSCPDNGCSGCCDGSLCLGGTEDDACGKGGETCAECTSQGQLCQAGACGVACTPDCTGKCAGAPDGCQGTCAANDCDGCCDGDQCQAGTADAACGKGGAACQSCGTGTSCSSQSCVKDSPTSECAGKTGGTTSCTKSGASGMCWAEACCTGCYDASYSLCRVTTNHGDTHCGEGGVSCTNCSTSGLVCDSGGSCVAGQPCGGSCASYETCDSSTNTCKVLGSSQWRLTLVDASINCTDRTWDTFCIGSGCSKPDVYVGLVWNATSASCTTSALEDWLSHKEDDTCTPSWNQDVTEWSGTPSNPVEKKTYSATELKQPICLQLIDLDLVFQEIGTCLISITDTHLKSGSKVVTYCKNQGNNKDYLIRLELKLTHVP